MIDKPMPQGDFVVAYKGRHPGSEDMPVFFAEAARVRDMYRATSRKAPILSDLLLRNEAPAIERFLANVAIDFKVEALIRETIPGWNGVRLRRL